MLATYQTLASIAAAEYADIVAEAAFVGGTSASPNKLRLSLVEGSFIDIWLSSDGDYAYHWERRRQAGEMYRWDNAPHYRQISTFPAHFHDGDETTIRDSTLSTNPKLALREILMFVRQVVD